MEAFIHFLKNNTGLKQQSDIDFIIENAECRILKKGDYLLRKGAPLNFAVFVEKGLLKQSVLSSEGKEHVFLFWAEGLFESHLDAMLNRNQTFNIDIQAIEESILYIIPHSIIEHYYNSNTDFALFNNKLMQAHISCARDRVKKLIGESAETRYMSFMAEYGHIAHRLPVALIAAYVGITRESLSRLRSDLAQHKNKK